MTVADEIRRIKQKKTQAQITRGREDAQREKRRLEGKRDQRVGGSTMNPSFLRTLEAKAAQVNATRPAPVRADLEAAKEKLRIEGKLPTPDEVKVGYVPTPEEILGDEALPKGVQLPAEELDLDCPSADDVLSAAQPGGEYAEGDLSPEELAEIDRLNPRQKAKPGAAKSGKVARRR